VTGVQTCALPICTPEGIEQTAARIEAVTGLPLYRFPKQREFFLGLWLEVDPEGGCRTRSVPETPGDPNYRPDELERRLVAATQAGLPLVPEPCVALAAQLDCRPADIEGSFARMLAAGVIRRIGLVPNHYRLGLRANGMSVWDIPDERLEDLGNRLGALDYVTHCYARPRRLPQWPYNLFAMVHGRERTEVADKVADMARLLNGASRGHEVLFSTAVLKKTGFRGIG
jgi:DNA-binding Lrp family transcriptional regulator